jgi:hypothetical protein
MKIDDFQGFVDIRDKKKSGPRTGWSINPLHISSIGVGQEEPNRRRTYRIFIVFVNTVCGKTYFKEFDRLDKRDEIYGGMLNLVLRTANLNLSSEDK